ncbi:MAG: hypothetical protein QOE08_728 [Thermoleophilaceae bacterium]|nr:hypothetical protein [Thermoleophilaceae bacterium]
MDLRRLRTGEWLTGFSGVALLAIMFLPWYGSSGSDATVNAWQAFTVTDVVFAIAALMGIALFIVTATQRTAAVPQALSGLLLLVAGVATLLALIRLVNLPGAHGVTREIGAWLGALACIALTASTWRSLLDERFPAAMRPHVEVEVLPAPAADVQPRHSS